MDVVEKKTKTIHPIFVVLYVIVVYSTIPFAPYAVDFLRKIFKQYYGVFVSTLIITLIAFIAVNSIKYLKNPRTAFWLLFLSFSGVFILITLEIPAERIHFMQYGFLAYLLIVASKRESASKYIFAFVFGSIIGFVDELIQLFFQYQKFFALPRRYFEWKDIGMNVFGVFLGCVFYRYVIEEGNKFLKNEDVSGVVGGNIPEKNDEVQARRKNF